jgi:hypothetical protein
MLQGSLRSDTVDSESTGPKRRLGSPLAVVAVAAVLAAGGGGAYWASTHGRGDGTEPSSKAPGGDRSPEPPRLTGTPASSGGRLTVADGVGLPPGRGSAPVRRPDTVPRAAVERLAKALGVPGAVKADEGFWKAGAARGADGPLLQVNRQAPGAWSYTLYGALPGPRKGAAPSAKQALRGAAAVLEATGLDGAASRTDAHRTAGALRAVTADPVLGGLPTYGWRTALEIGPDGRVVSGSGRLSPLRAGAAYPVVSAEQALKALNRAAGDGTVGAAGCPGPGPEKSTSPGDQTLPRVVPCIPARAQQMTVRTAEFGLSAQFVDGGQALVPSWLFTVARGGAPDTYVLPAQAVEPALVRTAPDGTPSPDGGRPAGTRTMDIESYTASGTTLTVRFWGGVCSTYSASAKESGDTVTVRVTGTPKHPGRVCAMIAKSFTGTVRLEKPVGDRRVVDARDGTSIASGAKTR